MDNTLYYDYKYLQLISGHLEGFRQIETHEWNFRCPICGDSVTKKHKQRAYIGLKESRLVFICFNCGTGMSFRNFLKEVDPDMYMEYRKEIAFGSIQKKSMDLDVFKQSKTFVVPEKKEKLEYISDLPENNHGRLYLLSRKIPETSFNKVCWTENYAEFVSKNFPDKYDTKRYPKKGLVFPLYSLKETKLVGYQYRSIDPNCPKSKRFLINVWSDEQYLFGLDKIDKNKPIFCVEGPIDAMCIENCVAVLNSQLWRYNNKNAIYFNDNEPRNAQIVKQVENCINNGLRTVILNEDYYNMDVNDIIVNHKMRPDQISDLFLNNSYMGLPAKMKFECWRKQ